MPDIDQEEFAARRFLFAIGLPVGALQHRDKPDFLIQINERRIGLEVCTGTPEELQRALQGLDQNQKSGFLFPGSLQHKEVGEPRRPTAELVNEIIDADGPWLDNEEAHERWRIGIERRLIDKQRAFTNPGFSRFDENWLLIYDLDVAPVHHTVDVSHVKRNLEGLRSSFKPDDYFDKIWIDFGPHRGLIEWTIKPKTIMWRGLPTGDESI